jgi:hypothetical protein
VRIAAASSACATFSAACAASRSSWAVCAVSSVSIDQSRLCGIRRRLGTEGLDVGLSPALRGDLLARSLQKTLGLDTRVLDDHGCLILRDPQHVLEPLALTGGLRGRAHELRRQGLHLVLRIVGPRGLHREFTLQLRDARLHPRELIGAVLCLLLRVSS